MTTRQWAHITDWKAELAPYYDQAKRMLGVVTNPLFTPSDEVMKPGRRGDGGGRHLPLPPRWASVSPDGQEKGHPSPTPSSAGGARSRAVHTAASA
jgi:cholesterol oxidase